MPPCVCNERCCGKNPAIKTAFLWIIQLFRKPWKFNYSWIVFEIISRSLSSLQSLDKFTALQNVILIILLQLTQCLPHLLWTEIAPFNWLILPIYSKTMLWSCSKCLILSVSFLWRAKCCSIDVKMCWSPNYTLLENRLSSWQCFTSYFLAYLIFFCLCFVHIKHYLCHQIYNKSRSYSVRKQGGNIKECLQMSRQYTHSTSGKHLITLCQ